MLIKSPDDKKKRLRLLEELRRSDRLDERQKEWLRNEYSRLVYRYFKPPFPRSARAAGSREAVNRVVFGDNPPLSMTIHLLTPAPI